MSFVVLLSVLVGALSEPPAPTGAPLVSVVVMGGYCPADEKPSYDPAQPPSPAEFPKVLPKATPPDGAVPLRSGRPGDPPAPALPPPGASLEPPVAYTPVAPIEKRIDTDAKPEANPTPKVKSGHWEYSGWFGRRRVWVEDAETEAESAPPLPAKADCPTGQCPTGR